MSLTDAAERFQRYRDLQAYVAWTSDDAETLRNAAELISPELPSIVDDFYLEVLRHGPTRNVITGGDAQIARLKASLHDWLLDLFSGDYAEEYLARQVRIGRRHVEIGLDQTYVNAAFTRVRQNLVNLLQASIADEAAARRTQTALERLLDVNLAIAADAYQTHFMEQQQPLVGQRLRQQNAVTRITSRAVSADDLDELLQHSVIVAAESLPARCCSAWLLEPGQDALSLVAAYGCGTEMVGRLRVKADSHSQVAYTLRHGGAVVANDLHADARFHEVELPRDAGVVSSLSAALAAEGETFGVLMVHESEKGRFLAGDSDFLLAVANTLAMAVKRLRDRRLLEEREQRLRRMVEHLPAGAAYCTEDALFVNRRLERITGYTRSEISTLDKWWNLLCGESAEENIAQYLSDRDAGFPQSRTYLIHNATGHERLLQISGFRADNDDEVWLVHDVTDLRAATERMLRSERLAAIGQTVAGLAHESRNALQRMQASMELLEMEVDGSIEAQRLLGRCQAAQEELHRLFDEVRDFAAPLKLETRTFSLPQAWREAWALLQPNKSTRTLKLIEHLAVDSPEITADRFRLTQVFRNAFENAVAATSGPLEVFVECRHCTIADQPGWEVILRDNGPGLTPDGLRRAFEPFYTTKAKGTGLGMPIALRIADAHGGDAELNNAATGGAEFTLRLPVSPP